MNNNYKWKGESFNSKGIIIEKTPIANKPQHSYTQYTIPGRSGYLAIDNKTFEPIVISLECHLDNNNVDINDIRAWLDGYGELQIDNEKKYTGFVSSAIPFEKVLNFRKFMIQYTVQPLAKAVTSTTVDASSIASFSADTYATSFPKITITCTGDVSFSINNVGFTLADANGTYNLDCEAKVITKNGINQSNIMSGEFPYIVNGTNSIIKSGTISALTIEYSKMFI